MRRIIALAGLAASGLTLVPTSVALSPVQQKPKQTKASAVSIAGPETRQQRRARERRERKGTHP